MNWNPTTLSRIARSKQNQTLKYCASLEDSETFLIDCFLKIGSVQETDKTKIEQKENEECDTIINTVTEVDNLKHIWSRTLFMCSERRT